RRLRPLLSYPGRWLPQPGGEPARRVHSGAGTEGTTGRTGPPALAIQLAARRHRPGSSTRSRQLPGAGLCPHNLNSLAHGSATRTRCVPKSTSTAVSPSTPTTLPRPYLSCVTRSRLSYTSAGSSTTGTLKGLPGRYRLPEPARVAFTSSTLRA